MHFGLTWSLLAGSLECHFADDASDVTPGEAEKQRMREMEWKERDRQRKWLYWSVPPPSSADWGKFKPLKPMHLLINPCHPFLLLHHHHPSPPHSVFPFCPLAVLTAAVLEGQISHIRYLPLRVPGFFFFNDYYSAALAGFQRSERPIHWVSFSWKEKHANFIEGEASPHTIAEGD